MEWLRMPEQYKWVAVALVLGGVALLALACAGGDPMDALIKTAQAATQAPTVTPIPSETLVLTATPIGCLPAVDATAAATMATKFLETAAALGKEVLATAKAVLTAAPPVCP